MSEKGHIEGISIDKVDVMACSQCGCEIDVAGLDPFIRVECPDCGNIETVPARLGGFLLLDLMGTGGMGGVYYAKDETLGRFVAIKVMLASIGQNKDFVTTFKREAQAVAKLNHPNIVQIYSFGEAKGQPYIVMELVSGGRLDKMIEESGQVDEGLVMQVGRDISQALSAADEIGLIHGDVKPENILFDKKFNAKLVDFGLATFAHQSQRDGIWGTPYYIAPEKVLRKNPDARSDMYSLGATLYHALTGHPPFEGEDPVDVVKARLDQRPPTIHARRQSISASVERVVMRMIETEPGRRHPTYASLISDFRKVIGEVGPARIGSKGAKGGSIKKKRTGKLIISKISKRREASDVRPRDLSSDRVSRAGARPRKSVIIKGRGKKAPAEEAPAPIPVPVAVDETKPPSETRSPGRPRIRSRRQRRSVVKARGAGKESAEGDAAAAPREKRKASKGAKAVGWVVTIVLLLVVGGGAFGLYLYNKEQKRLQRLEYFTLQARRKEAADLQSQIQAATAELVTASGEVKGMVRQATNAVYFVTGGHLAPKAAAVPAARTRPTVASDIPPGVGSKPPPPPTVAARTPPPAAAKPPEPPPPPEVSVVTKPKQDREGREEVIGILSIEELRKRQGK